MQTLLWLCPPPLVFIYTSHKVMLKGTISRNIDITLTDEDVAGIIKGMAIVRQDIEQGNDTYLADEDKPIVLAAAQKLYDAFGNG